MTLMGTRPRRVALGLLLAGLLASDWAVWGAQAPTQTGGRRPRTTKPKPPLPEKPQTPMTLTEIEAIAGGGLPAARVGPVLGEQVQRRGVAFQLGPEEEKRLNALNLPANVLLAIRSRALPLPPPPAPKGNLAVACEPAECQVSLNGRPVGVTRQSRMLLGGQTPGRVAVQFSREGYVGQEQTVEIVADKTVNATPVVLEPSRTTLEAQGRQLFEQMLAALGGDEGLAAAGMLEAGGAATLYSTTPSLNGEWGIRYRLRSPDRAAFLLTSGQRRFDMVLLPSGESKFDLRKLPNEVAGDLETLLRQVRETQVAEVIDRIRKRKPTALVDQAAGGQNGTRTLRLESPTETYVIDLDESYRPNRLRLVTGLGQGKEITYAGYQERGKAQIPQLTTVKLPDGQRHGIDVKLTTIQAGATFQDQDFEIRGRRRPFQ